MDNFPLSAPAFNGSSRVVAGGNAFEWVKEGWAMFVSNPGMWIAMTVILIVIMVALNIVPLIGTMASYLLTPLFSAGMLAACEKAAKGGTLEINDLFTGFKHNTGSLVMVGVLYMAGMLAILFILAVLGGGSVASGLMMGRPAGFGVAFGGMMFAMLLSMALSIPLMMAIWFAPALVYFNNMAPVDALKASFNACLKNLLAFLVYGVVLMVLSFFAALPVGLGFLILIPVIAGSLYVSYRDIFVAN